MRNKLRREIIKQRLKEEIESSNLSLKEIAEQIDINPSLLSQYKTTRKMPSLETFSKICEVLEVDANYILGLID